MRELVLSDPPFHARVRRDERCRICGLCGAAFVLVMPPGEGETERDKFVRRVPDAAAGTRRASLNGCADQRDDPHHNVRR